MKFTKIKYETLNSKQQEIFNFQKASSIFADYGFKVIKLSDDWNGADFIAQHFNTDAILKIQLKGRLTFDKKYCGKNIWICFRSKDSLYLYPHDEVMETILTKTNFMKNTDSWDVKGGYHRGVLSKELDQILSGYKLGFNPAHK